MAFARAFSSRTRAAGAPIFVWWLLLALGSGWLRYGTPWGVIYPGQWLLAPLLVWALWRGPLALPGGGFEPPPLTPLLAFGGFVLLLAVLRGQWGAALTTVVGASALAPWAWASYRVGVSETSAGTFQRATVLYLATTLGVGLAMWWTQAESPAACALLECDPATPIPYAFTGGWATSAQYLVALIFLLPSVGGAFWNSWRRGSGSLAHWLLTLAVAAAGLGLLAGMRWWVFGILGLGVFLMKRALASEGHPADRLLLRGVAFFCVFGPVALYGTVPGYGTALLFQPGSARSIGVRHTLPRPVVLSSEHDVSETVQAVNAGTVPLSASPERPLRLGAVILFTPRTGGESRMVPAGDARIVRDLSPGETVDVTVPIRVPPWVSQGYVSWTAEDETGRPIQLAEAVHHGFRFVNGDFTALTEGGDNTLSALAARARDSAAPGLAVSAAGVRRGMVEPVLSDAFDTLFFSPLWGQPGATRPFGELFDPARPFLLGVFHQYGLIGLALLTWFFVGLLRRSIQLGFGHHAGLAWRMVPVSVLLLAATGVPSGALGRFHSWWGCVLLGGFVQGAYERVYPARARAARRAAPAWMARSIGVARGLAWMAAGATRGVAEAGRLMAHGMIGALERLTRVPVAGLRFTQRVAGSRRAGGRNQSWSRRQPGTNRPSWRIRLLRRSGPAGRSPWPTGTRHARGSPYRGAQ